MSKSKLRAKRLTPTAPAEAPHREGVFEITAWKAVNWHNLLTQEQTVVGDIFNLGPNESGKTTLLDGIHFALTFGEPHMEWNSAADPNASESKLKREGRTLKDVIFRVNEHTQNETPNIVYFAVELTNRRTGEVYSIAVGAYAASIEAEVQKWGLILPKPLREVKLIDDANEIVYDEDRLEEAYGSHNVHQVRRFRQKMAELFFGSGDDYDQIIKMWKLGKSYNRLVHQSDNFAELLRQALPRPDPADFDSARSQLETIRGIRAAISSITQQRDQLLLIESHQKEIQRQRAAIARYDLRDTTNEIEAKERAQQEASAEHERLASALSHLGEKEGQLRAELQQKEGLISDLQGAGVDEISRATQRARAELDAAVARLTEANRQHDKAATALRRASDVEEKAWDSATFSLKNVSQTVEKERARLPRDAPAAFIPAFSALTSALLAVRREHPELGEAYADAVGALETFVNQQREYLWSIERDARAEEEATSRMAQERQGTRDALAVRKDIPPHERLPIALRGIENSVLATYTGIEVKTGREREAALLEAYLGPMVLGAAIPLQAESAERVKRHVQARATDVKVVDVANLRAHDLPSDSILTLIDVERSHPLAVSYLVSEYADVRLRDTGEPRGSDERVIWRSGEVYDGHAWVLAHVEENPRFLGKEARAETLRRQLAALDEEIRSLRGKAQEAKARAAEAQTKRETYTSIRVEILASFNRNRVDATLRALSDARNTLAHAREAEAREASAVDRERREWSARQERLTALEEESRRSGADKQIETLTAARTRVQQLHGELEGLANQRGSCDNEVKAQTAKLEGSKAALANLLPQKREQFEKLRTLLHLTAPEVDAYLREHGFHRIKHTPQAKRDEASTAIGEARGVIDKLIVELSGKRSLRFDFMANTVVESVGGRPLSKLVDELEGNLAKKHIEDVEATRLLSEKIIVEGIASRIKEDVLALKELLDRVNENLKSVAFRGTRYKIQDVPLRDSKISQIRNLIMEASAETSHENLAQFIQHHLEGATPIEADVPELFDYRRWYDFRIVTIQTDAEGDLRDRSAKGSGGRQAVPKYLFCFCLFSILYDRLASRLRVVLIDEAFQRIDPGNIDQLIRFAKSRDLHLIITNPDLDGATESMQASTVNMFHKNERNETFIQRWTRMATAVYVRRTD